MRDRSLSIDDSLDARMVGHHLRLFGLGPENTGTEGGYRLWDRPGAASVLEIREFAARGGQCVIVLPDEGFCATFGVAVVPAHAAMQERMSVFVGGHEMGPRPRTLHASVRFRHPAGRALVTDALAEPAWLQVPAGRGSLIFVGTNIAADLVRYRQGDPARAAMRQTEPQWGYAGERPVYLYEEQLRDADRFDRDADWWAVALARVIANAMGISLAPVLPDDAAGAVIVTGDDDQAALEKYAEQLALLDNTPVTYFLHPQTRHTRESVRVMLGKPWIDLGLHPDALDAPSRYRELLLEQGERIADLIGHRPLSVRNHGFLNDGYWGHLPAWLEYGIRISSNLPGVDGRVLNGSLLPARLVYGQSLTRHWSLLTAIGDGMRFALNSTDAQAGRRILDLADAIRASGVPGIIVLNLHPENVLETREMHRAAIEVIRSGFCAWTMRECLEWFERRDAGAPTPGTGDFLGPIRKIWRRLSVIGS